MRIRMKKRGVLGLKRIGIDGKIGKIEVRENPAEGKLGLSIFFKGLEGMGVVSFSEKEIEMIRDKIKGTEKKEGKKK